MRVAPARISSVLAPSFLNASTSTITFEEFRGILVSKLLFRMPVPSSDFVPVGKLQKREGISAALVHGLRNPPTNGHESP